MVLRQRPISRWISWVRPDWRPRAASRSVRTPVALGSMPYSAVIQPLPEPLSQWGTRCSTVAVHSTWVSPRRTKHDPSACLLTSGSRRTVRIWSAARPEGLMKGPFVVSA